ncbi:hypothetical protein KFE25_005471 [Diacronema lutheri]|uniref:Uncharacterized protein n=1 Tax=Diacronema lutheri TaxID=2081491 RepID=A0A8J5XJX3_DIALT|nr:hypothetical protein KFE25_005471 [Diacronema lutheri]
MLRDERWKEVASEALSQLTTAACGVLLGIVTAPRVRRAIASRALVLFRQRGAPVCAYGNALVQLPPQTASDVCAALLTCADEPWAADAFALPSAGALLAGGALLFCGLMLCALPRTADETAETVPVERTHNVTTKVQRTLPAKRDARRRFVSVEYDALVASTSVECNATLPS